MHFWKGSRTGASGKEGVSELKESRVDGEEGERRLELGDQVVEVGPRERLKMVLGVEMDWRSEGEMEGLAGSRERSERAVAVCEARKRSRLVGLALPLPLLLLRFLLDEVEREKDEEGELGWSEEVGREWDAEESELLEGESQRSEGVFGQNQ